MMWTPKGVTLSLGFGILLVIIGTVIVITKPNEVLINQVMNTNLRLVNGTFAYEVWKSVDVEFEVYLFDIVNPEEVQKLGAVAILAERGPYVYDVHVDKVVNAVDESADTIEHMTQRTMFFNATKSGNLSEYDEVTVLNSAYMGTIIKIVDLVPDFLSTIGVNIPLLFTERESIFIKGRVKDILFDGLSVTCDPDTYPELGMVCMVLENQRPPNLRATSEEGVYRFSFFHGINGTMIGPFTINRGVKDRFVSGMLSGFKGSHYTNVWNEKECTEVKGTDALFYPPLKSRGTEIFTFIPEFCSPILVEYKNDKIINGILGYHYRTSLKTWDYMKPSCYCPRNATGDVACLLSGLLDLLNCQDGPVLMSEAHFLHGDPGLYSIVEGLHPDEEEHASYVVVDPLTGAPLSGAKQMQLNMMLQQEPLDLLANVSEGVFPLVRAKEGLTPTPKMLEAVILLHRIRKLLGFIIWIPFVVGILVVLHSLWMNIGIKAAGRRSGRVRILVPNY